MSSSTDKLAKTLYKAFSDSESKLPKPADDQATVSKVDGDTVWVKIPGGVDETPVRRTVSAKPGDVVQVRRSGGRAWITGNATNPPTDDTRANQAYSVGAKASVTAEVAIQDAARAKEAADNAEMDAARAHTAADMAQAKANEAYQSAYEAGTAAQTANGLAQQAKISADNAQISADTANSLAAAAGSAANEAKLAAQDAADDAAVAHTMASNAKDSADAATSAANDATMASQQAKDRANEAYDSAVTANTAASGAIESLSIVEDVLGVLNWVAEHASYKKTEDTTVVPSKYYFEKIGEDYRMIVPPADANPKSLGYYEIDDIKEAVSNYVATHLALVDNGLMIQTTTDEETSRMLVSPTEGVVLYGPDGSRVATYGQSTIIGNENSFNIRISSSETSGEVGFYEGSMRVAYINNQSLYITQSVVLDEMMLGENKWVWRYDNRDDSIFLKWIG